MSGVLAARFNDSETGEAEKLRVFGPHVRAALLTHMLCAPPLVETSTAVLCSSAIAMTTCLPAAVSNSARHHVKSITLSDQ